VTVTVGLGVAIGRPPGLANQSGPVATIMARDHVDTVEIRSFQTLDQWPRK
jgi:hypothetical protein